MKGSCLCGNVTWEIEGPLDHMAHCHCSRCRKTHGTAFATYAAAPAAAFRLNGRESVVRWQSSPDYARCFCRQCGSVVPSDPFGDSVFIPAGNFDGDPGMRPLAHVFVASKAPWYEIRDSLPQFDAYPPGFDAPVLPDREPLNPRGGARGSCLCGKVTFVIDGTPIGCWNCHCGRCRKARSAAHATNLFLPADALCFTSGEGEVVSYKVPDAIRFAQHFCRTCGAKAPRIDRERGIVGIPMGAFDDDPAFKPQAHIFVASKAPWFEISDDLPQHAEYPS